VICCEDFVVKSGVHAAEIRHVRPKLLCSSSGAVKSLEQGLPLGAKLKHSNLERTCSIHILKRPFILAQSAPSAKIPYVHRICMVLANPTNDACMRHLST